MNRITSVMAMQARDRGTWMLVPATVLGAIFAIAWCIVLLHDMLTHGTTGTFTPGLATFIIVVMVGGIGSIGATYPFAVSFDTLRRDFVLGTLGIAAVVSAGWALVLGLLSLLEAGLLKGWGVGMHFFYLPWFSDGSHLRQFCWTTDAACVRSDPSYASGGAPLAEFWVYFILLLFMSLLGLVLGSLYQRSGRTGVYIVLGFAWLFLGVFLLVASYWRWWGVIVGWLGGQTAAGLVTWLLLPIACFALALYALLRKATV